LYNNNIWDAHYAFDKNKIIHQENEYPSLSTFAKAHVKSIQPELNYSIDGWKTCLAKHNNEWIPANQLFEIKKK
jgi:hypothetical protein